MIGGVSSWRGGFALVLTVASVLLAPAFAAMPGALAASSADSLTIGPGGAPDVVVVREHMFLSRGPAGAQVLHLLEVANPGPRQAVRVPLPVPAQAQWEQVPEPLEIGDGGLVDPRPLAIGEGREYVVAYTLPWRDPMVLRRPLLYPVEELWLWADTGSVVPRGVQLLPAGREEVEGLEFAVYRMERLEPHPAWQVVLERPEAAAAPLPLLQQVGMRADPVEVLAHHPLPRFLVAALLVAGVVWAAARLLAGKAPGQGGSREALAGDGSDRASGAPPPRRPVSPPAVGQDGFRLELERLKEEIVRLDVAYHNGELDEDVYRERRAGLKARLVQLSAKGGGTLP